MDALKREIIRYGNSGSIYHASLNQLLEVILQTLCLGPGESAWAMHAGRLNILGDDILPVRAQKQFCLGFSHQGRELLFGNVEGSSKLRQGKASMAVWVHISSAGKRVR